MLGPTLTGNVPAHPVSENYLAALSSWQMLGNDYFGDCVSVTWANERRLVTALLAGRESYPALDQVYALYRTQNPRFVPNPSDPIEDNGMDIQTCLEYLHTTGGPDGVRAVAFAKVDVRSLDQLKAALAIFGCVWAGINVLRVNGQEFDAGQPWDYVANSPIDGGHSVMQGGYLGPAANDVRFITWGEETGFTDAFLANELEEAWVVVWPEHLGSKQFLEGVDLAAFGAAYKALTGDDLPVAPPAPSPSGCLDTADRALFAAMIAGGWLFARHSGQNRLVALAGKAWASAKGLL